MKEYEVSREIYNPCAGVYIFDDNFFKEIQTDNIENTIAEWIGGSMPNYDKNTFSDGSVEYILDLPRKIRYTFNIL
ncbi:hypothetical protein [Terrisporobacter petrolearius]|uniref:hypothetical protein n=1 Tax=Terrisporobacter petrolearius TaxID=1460447 RepID=UPI003B004991